MSSEKLPSNENKDQQLSFTQGKRRQFDKPIAVIVSFIAIIWSAYQLYTVYFGPPDAIIHRSIHLTFALTLIFILVPPSVKVKSSKLFLVIDVMMALASLAVGVYIYSNADVLYTRVGLPIVSDYIFGFIALLLVLEATRRVLGVALPIVAICLLIYALTGDHWPQAFAHPGNDLADITSYLFLSLDGIYGVALGVSATLLVVFILLAYFLMATGAGEFFMDISNSLIGWVRGGPAKMSVISSGFFGSITGSPTANVVSTGTITIPLMKRLGYKPHFSGAVEAAASTGGQFMPPIMGATAFIMADTLGIPYSDVVIAAIVPAILYYLALLIMVDLEASKNNLKGIPKKELPSLKKVVKKGWFQGLPLLLLLYLLLILDYSPALSAFYSIALLVIINLFNKKNRLTLKQFFKVLEQGATGTMEIAIACACAGIIIGSFSLTGLGPRLSSILLELSQGSMFLLLIFTMIASIIMGMALPTIVSYMVLSVLVAPTLIEMGVLPIAAHMFVLFFGVVSYVTPPIAFAAYAGAALAGSNVMKTGITSSRLAICSFILPFMFVYNPELLLQGAGLSLILALLSAVVGVIAISMAAQGYIFQQLQLWKRLLLLISGIFLVQSNIYTDLVSYFIFAVITFNEYKIKTKKMEVKDKLGHNAG
ncbi:TRAP transporter permease [Lentibacillus sp. Marseille-P4043]|uniref:TRAP transporter permease n=1 Tax=Lentibacillus sp. Marseille-P4043 TaxID=2040293 RepID=UPI000D0B9A92|nr:TRAP transporter permease [Lentibacillus sp. Marseille-P4043]